MELQTRIAILGGALALAAIPASAPAAGPVYTPAPPPPGPKSGLPEQAKAYGRYCKGESKKHVKGEKGTEFSRCVKALKKAANNPHMSPGRVCKGKSKEHVKGEQGTEFSRCVKAVAQLRKDEKEGV
jgi:hypothetical protein